MRKRDLKNFLDEQVERFNEPGFIKDDPIQIPHRFSKLQDIEITGFWVAMLAWGQRKTIINKSLELIELMDGAPYDFIKNHSEHERKSFLNFKHRTFQATDTLYFLEVLQQFYQHNDSLETAFIKPALNEIDAPRRAIEGDHQRVEMALRNFHDYFFSLPDAPHRTKKHIATPARKSTCKRLNMFLRWMVRKDDKGVDFGLWNNIQASELMMPLDVHVERVARQLGLLTRKQRDWRAVVELTDQLRRFDPEDPVKYDFALFGMGVMEQQSLRPKTKRP